MDAITSLARRFVFTVAALLLAAHTSAQTLPRPSQVNVSVSATVTYNASTGLFTYLYTLTNFADALLEVSELHIPLTGVSVLNVKSPPGWESILNPDGRMVNWCACSENGFEVPPGYVEDGRGLPSKFQIKPGQSLGGFSFDSPYPQTTGGQFYAAGWVPVPIEGVDFPEGQEPPSPNFPDNRFRGTLPAVPFFNPTLEFGGRRPSVDGFLVFTSIVDGGSYTSPVLIDIEFSRQGETVDTVTFRATLNGIDVTSQFVALDSKRRRTVVTVGPALKVGKNVLITSVEGTVPGSTRRAKDTDRITFLAQ